MDFEILLKLWPLIAGAVGGIGSLTIWCIKLDAEVKYLRKDHEAHKEAQSNKDQAVWKKLDYFQLTMSEAVKTLSRIEGKLEGHTKD